MSDVLDYHNFTTKCMPGSERKGLNVGDLWENKWRCDECGDIVRSRNAHDYRTCTCGNLSVDGGSWYSKISAKEIASVTNLSVLFDDVEKDV